MQIWHALTLLMSNVVIGLPIADVALIDGSQLNGELTSMSDEEVKITANGQVQTVASEQLQAIILSKKQATIPEGNNMTVKLHDGSKLRAKSVLATATTARITIGEELSYRFQSDSIASIQFKPLTKQAQEDYDSILEGESTGDVIIVLRPSGAIDELEGIVERVDNEAVTFNFDGDRIPVELSKLAGVKLLKSGSLERSKTTCELTDLRGNRWRACRFNLNAPEAALEFETGLGDKISLQLDQIQKFQFASRNLVYLSDLSPENAEWTPYLTGRLVRNRLNQLYAPVKDRSANGGPIAIGEQEFTKGLSLRSKTVLTYRLTEEFTSLQLTAGLAAETKGRGHIDLIILGDNKQLFRDSITDPADIRQLELDVTGVRRLSITVDYGKNLDFGDLLHLGDAKLIK
ncbi:MAG: hypothetical protein CMM02_14520 [Rhodopirellula sp.]|nr:hypothetical protein [Rhodopirellula sp.]